MQSYLRTPHLLDGYKYDLRLYVLVTSFAPLEAFIYDEGFARVSTHKFSAAVGDLSNKYIHLTNSSIQKNNASGPASDNPAATARVHLVVVALPHGQQLQRDGEEAQLHVAHPY